MSELNGGGRILVVDDEPSIVDAVATALRYEGFEVREEGTGRAAIAAVADFDPDLVVLDWMLPDLDGIEVGRRLRERGFKTASTIEGSSSTTRIRPPPFSSLMPSPSHHFL